MEDSNQRPNGAGYWSLHRGLELSGPRGLTLEYIVQWVLLAISVVVTGGVVAVMFFRRTSNVNLKIRGLGLEINFSANRAARRREDGNNP